MRSDVFWTVASKLAFMVAKLLVVVMIARRLGPSNQGVYALFVSSSTISASIFVLGQNISNNLFVARYRGTSKVGKIVGNGLLLTVGSVIAASITAALVFHNIYAPPAYAGPLVTLLVGLAAAGSVLQLALAGVLFGLGRFRLRALLQMTQQFVLLAGVVVVVDWGLSGVLLVWTGAQLLLAVASFVALMVIGVGRLGLDRQLMAEQVKHGAQSQGYMIAQNINARADVLVVGALFSPSVVGFYTVATSAAEALMVIPKAVGDIVLSRIRAYKSWLGVRRVLIGTATGAGMVAFPALALAYWLFPVVFGPAYVASWPYLAILTPGIILGGVGTTGTFALFGIGETARGVRNTIAAAGAAVLGAFVLAQSFGPAGAALASTGSYALHCVLTVWSLKHLPKRTATSNDNSPRRGARVDYFKTRER